MDVTHYCILELCLKAEFWDNRSGIYLTVWESTKAFSKVGLPYYSISAWKSSASHSGPHFGGFIIIYLTFICMSQIYGNTEHFSMYLLTIWTSFWNLFKILSNFLFFLLAGGKELVLFLLTCKDCCILDAKTERNS